MKRMISYVFLFILLNSCISTETGVPTSELIEYITKEKSKSVYVIDTIQIDNPVRFFTKKGYQFVMSQKAYQSYSGKEGSLFQRPDAFLTERLLPVALSPEVFDRYDFTGSPYCSEHYILYPKKKGGIREIYSYSREPDFFLLILIRGDYYNKVYAGLGKSLQTKSSVYYKVAIPCCIEK